MDPQNNAFYLMTYHGTLVVTDDDGVIRRHVPLALIKPRRHGILTRMSLGINAITLSISENSQPVFSVLKNGSIYLTAEPDGRMTQHAKVEREWETLLVVSAATWDALRHIVSNSWIVNSNGAVIRPWDIRLEGGFMLRLGAMQINLADRVPLQEKITKDKITLLEPVVSDGRPFFAERLSARDLVPPPRIWIKPMGNSANRALQYLVAKRIQELAPEVQIDNIRLPEWGMDMPSPEPPLRNATRLAWNRFWIDIPGLADCLQRRVVDILFLDCFSFNLDHYPDRAICRSLLGPTSKSAVGFGRHELVCSIRGGEVLRNAHPDYIVLPPAYYRMLADISGLDLVFFGQIGDDPYSQSLRNAFPRSRFVVGQSPEHDFEVLRQSLHIAPSISTFAWLAAWLSEAETVYLPVGGFFSPVQHPSQMHLPLDEPSYRFFLLPYSKAVDVFKNPLEFQVQQELLGSLARPIERRELQALCARALSLWPMQPRVGGFDPAYYLARYPDVAAKLKNELPSALEHYIHTGFQIKSQPLDFDPVFYTTTYPEAAMAIAEGYFTSPLQHYLNLGWGKGYLPQATNTPKAYA